MGGTTKRTKRLSLKTGRPPVAAKSSGSLSSKATQKTIVTFHQLNKQLDKARAQGDDISATNIQAQIDQLGGIRAYQKASIQGQAVDRGGDSSSTLLKWLEPIRAQLINLPPETHKSKPTILEIGALSTKNAISKSQLFHTTHIDLHSQNPGIQQQDFMLRPLPTSPAEKFHIISLSLVLNFVPDAKARGEMLRRTTAFLHRSSSSSTTAREDLYTGLLFLVLPAPCLVNSRYANDERLAVIMGSLGFALVQRKQTAKLVYHLWQLRDEPVEGQRFDKVKVKDGAGMNNFCIVLA